MKYRFPIINLTGISLLGEFSGAFGDLATLLPLLIALTNSHKVSLPASLIFGGIFNIFTGIVYNIPMCVQPMKSIAAIALLGNMSALEVAGASLAVSAIVFVIGATNATHLLHVLVPGPVIRGVQLGVALALFSSGVKSILSSNAWVFASAAFLDNYLTAILASVFALGMYSAKRNISGAVLFLLACVFAIVQMHFYTGEVFIGLAAPVFGVQLPAWTDVLNGFLKAGLGQLPLTLLNSVLAVSALATDLFPLRTQPVASSSSIAMSVGIMNMLGAWFGCIPYCHGSGGLAGQYRFGARTGISVIILGVTKLVIGLAFSNWLSTLFHNFSRSIIGVMLCIAGIQLASVTRDFGLNSSLGFSRGLLGSPDNLGIEEGDLERAWMVMIVNAACTLGFSNDGIGFVAGIVTFWILRLTKNASKTSSASSNTVTVVEVS